MFGKISNSKGLVPTKNLTFAGFLALLSCMPAAHCIVREDYVLWSKHAINICICPFYLLTLCTIVQYIWHVFGQINRCTRGGTKLWKFWNFELDAQLSVIKSGFILWLGDKVHSFLWHGWIFLQFSGIGM